MIVASLFAFLHTVRVKTATAAANDLGKTPVETRGARFYLSLRPACWHFSNRFLFPVLSPLKNKQYKYSHEDYGVCE